MSIFKPVDELEQLVIKKDNRKIVRRVIGGSRLTRPDVFAEKQAYQITLEALMVLALLGLPKNMRRDAVDYVCGKCGQDSGIYNFLRTEFKHSGKQGKPLPEEARLLRAICEGDEQVILALAGCANCIISADLPDEYITCISRLTEKAQKELFYNGFHARPLVHFIIKLLSPELENETIPIEVAQLKSEDRIGMIKRIVDNNLAWVGFYELNDHPIELDSFRGKSLKSHLKENKGWGMYDLWTNSVHFDYRRDWSRDALGKSIVLLKDLDIPFEVKPRKNEILFQIPIPHDKEKLLFSVFFKEDYMIVYAKWPYLCPQSHYADMMEYLNYVNSELASGFFFLDTFGRDKSAAVHLKSFQLYSEAIDYQPMLLHNMIGNSMRIFEQFHNGLFCVADGSQSAKDAYGSASESIYSNFCDWYDDSKYPQIIYHFPKNFSLSEPISIRHD